MNNKSGLSDFEMELDELAEKIIQAKSSLARIGVLRKYFQSKKPEKNINFISYEDLPDDIKQKLFKAHMHGELVQSNEIVYREVDVLNIISYLLEK
jgi:hypothetical protein